MCRLSHWCGQQQHLLQRLQVLGAQEMQWAQATKNLDYRSTPCHGTAHPLDGRSQREIQVGPDKLEVVASFCYLGDMLSAACGCEVSTTIRVKTACKSSRSCYQFSLPPPLFQDTWPGVQLLCAERKPPTSAAK